MLTGASVAGNLFAPSLLDGHPLLLVALAPRTAYLAAAAGDVPFAVFVGVAVLRLCAADPSHFLLGRLHGDRASAFLSRRRRPGRPANAGRRRVTLTVLWERMGLVLVALSPSGKVLLLAGASRLPHRRVASAAVAGTVVQVVLLYAVGRAAAGSGQAVAVTMAAWAPILALTTVGLMAVTAIVGRLRRRGPDAGPDTCVSARLAGGGPHGPLGCALGLAVGFDGRELQAPVVRLLEQRALAAGAPQLHLQVAAAGHVDPHP